MVFDKIKDGIESRRKTIETLKNEIEDLREQCPHFFEPLTQKDLADEYMSVGAYCVACQHDFGWRCKISPDGACHYFTEEDGQVTLNDGRKVDGTTAQYYTADYQTDDTCIFCGEPDERK